MSLFSFWKKSFVYKLFKSKNKEDQNMKYLLVGLGNIGDEYAGTRHNIGFKIADKLAEKGKISFKQERLAFIANFKYRGRSVYVIKPTTYMNLSGKAVKYWMDKLKIKKSHVLVNVDDINLDFGKLRIRKKGSDGGHNGLKDIQNYLGTDYNRLRVGVGSEFSKGQQVDYVLGEWSAEQKEALPAIISKAVDANLDFVFRGMHHVINNYNG
jgi:PTH1 family peptidyl-tRNA hydrolase